MRCPKCGKFMERVNPGEIMDGWLCNHCEWFIDFDYDSAKNGDKKVKGEYNKEKSN